MKKKGRKQEEPGSPWVSAMCILLKGGVLAGVVAMAALLLCAALVSAGLLRERWMDGAVLAVCVAGAVSGGLYAALKLRDRAMLMGPGVGCVLFLLLLTAGLLAYDTSSLEQGGAGILCACLCGGAIAGILGRKPKKKRRR